jgi:hypothetical protein
MAHDAGAPNDEFRKSRRLWSLWDMLNTHGFKIAKAVIMLSEAKWMWIALDQKALLGDPQTTSVPLSREGIEAATQVAIALIREACSLSKLDGAEPEIKRLEDLIWPPLQGMPKVGGASIATAITRFLSRLQDEFSARYYFCLDQNNARFYEKHDLFGEAVARKFKDAADDIKQAGNCLALEQPTACVFHLMRAMEVAVRQLSKRLKIKVTPQTTWRVMTNNMDPKIRAMPDVTQHQKNRKNEWEAARANLHAVGSVWRNNTMHPATSYTQTQALDVFNAVRVFMSNLAIL